MISETDLTSLVAEIYEAGLDFERWPNTLRRLADALGAPSAGMARQGASLAECWCATVGLDPSFERDYRDHYHAVNPIWQGASDTPAGTVQTDTMVMPRSEFARTEFFGDFLAPLRIGGMLNAVALMEDGRQTVVTVHSPREWEAEHVALHQRLTPHLRRALELNVRLARAEINEAVSSQALDALEDGVVFVDDAGLAGFANAAAERAFSAPGGLRLIDGALSAASPADTAALRAAIGRCGPPQRTGSAISLSRPGGGSPLQARVSPVSHAMPAWFGGHRPMAIVCLTDPDRAAKPASELLRTRFGLTPAQAALALEILDGDGIQAAADRLAITRSTARTHLARIFEKTGTQRQSELVRVLMTGALSPWRDRAATGRPE